MERLPTTGSGANASPYPVSMTGSGKGERLRGLRPRAPPQAGNSTLLTAAGNRSGCVSAAGAPRSALRSAGAARASGCSVRPGNGSQSVPPAASRLADPSPAMGKGQRLFASPRVIEVLGVAQHFQRRPPPMDDPERPIERAPWPDPNRDARWRLCRLETG